MTVARGARGVPVAVLLATLWHTVPVALASQVPRMRELGVDHLLVDLPVFAPAGFRDEVARLRELV